MVFIDNMKATELLKEPKFKESLEMIMKGYIESMYAKAGEKPPIPSSLIPLTYDDAKVQKGLNQLMQGAKNALYAYDKFLEKK